MESSSRYALVHGLQRTRGTLEAWRARPVPVLFAWYRESVAVAALLLAATWTIALFSRAAPVLIAAPPLVTGDLGDLWRILAHNALVLALHAMACVAGFIAGSSLPLQARHHTGVARWVHERGRVFALAFVVAATGFSLSMQALRLGDSVAAVAAALHTAPGLLLLVLAPHALPELVALFLPLAAWIAASRRGAWDSLLAATFVTVALAVPMLLAAAAWEVWVAPRLVQAVV